MLGLEDRVQTTMRLPRRYVEKVSEVCRVLSIPRNVFFVLAGAHFLIELSPILPGRRRDILLNDIEKIFQKTISAIRENH